MPKRPRAVTAPPSDTPLDDGGEWSPAGARLLRVAGLPALFALAASDTRLRLFSSETLPAQGALLAALGAGARSVVRRGCCAAPWRALSVASCALHVPATRSSSSSGWHAAAAAADGMQPQQHGMQLQQHGMQPLHYALRIAPPERRGH